MKTLAIIFLMAIAWFSADGKIVVRGKIIGYDGKSKVSYTPTIEGIFATYWYDIKPEPDGTFRIEYENEGYGNLKVYYKSMSFRFFHDANTKIYFEVREVPERKVKRRTGQKDMFTVSDSLKRAHTIKITGDYASINQFYNQNLRSSYTLTSLVGGHYYSLLISKAVTPALALSKLDSLTQIEIRQVDQMTDVEKLNTLTHDFLKNEIYSFYAAVFLNSMYLKRVAHIKAAMADTTVNPDIYNRDWEMLVENMKEQFRDLKPAANSPDYVNLVEGLMNAMDDYKRYEFPKADSSSLDNWVTNRMINYDTTLLKDPKVRFEFELFGMQLFLNNQMMYSPVLLNAVSNIQKKHAGSAHLKFYQPKIDELKAYLEKSIESNVIKESYNSFGDLVKRFEGQNLFIDIWATWCGPCVEEFKNKSIVESFANRKEVTVLYISIDKSAWEDRWKKNIAANDLQGSHFRADRKFIDDMWNSIGGERGVIPRYVLVDRKGKIFQSNAPPPHESEELTRQIKALISQ